MEPVIKKVFEKHIKKGGIISSPDKLASAIAVAIEKHQEHSKQLTVTLQSRIWDNAGRLQWPTV